MALSSPFSLYTRFCHCNLKWLSRLCIICITSRRCSLHVPTAQSSSFGWFFSLGKRDVPDGVCRGGLMSESWAGLDLRWAVSWLPPAVLGRNNWWPTETGSLSGQVSLAEPDVPLVWSNLSWQQGSVCCSLRTSDWFLCNSLKWELYWNPVPSQDQRDKVFSINWATLCQVNFCVYGPNANVTWSDCYKGTNVASKALLFFSAGFYAPAFENIYWLNSLLLTEMVMYQQDSEKEIGFFFCHM